MSYNNYYLRGPPIRRGSMSPHVSATTTTSKTTTTKLPTISNGSFLINQTIVEDTPFNGRYNKKKRMQFDVSVQRPLSPLPERTSSPPYITHLAVPPTDETHRSFVARPRYLTTVSPSRLQENSSQRISNTNTSNPSLLSPSDAVRNAEPSWSDQNRRNSSIGVKVPNTSTFDTIHDVVSSRSNVRRRSSVMEGNLRRASRIMDRFEQQQLAKDFKELAKNKNVQSKGSIYDELEHCRYLRLGKKREYDNNPSCPCNKCEKIDK